MSVDIERLRESIRTDMAPVSASAVLALIERLEEAERDADRFAWLEQQARKSRTGISFDWIPSVDGEPSGYRFMRFHFIGEQANSIRQAIDKARGAHD